MSEWLRFHIFTGIVGPYLVLLHTAWTFRGLAGVVMLLTILIVLSGFLGRYIYTAVPRTVDGVEIELEDLDARIESARRELQDSMDDDAEIILAEVLLGESDAMQARAGLILSRGPKYWIWRVQRWVALRGLDPEARLQANRTDALVSRVQELQRQRASLAIVRWLLSIWHTVHVPLGMALFMAALFHIGAALYYATLLK